MKDRISFMISQIGVTKTEFAKTIRVSQGFVSQLCSGASSPSDRTIELICQQYGVNEVWLRTGEGEPFQEKTREEEIMRFAVQTVKGSNEFRKALAAMLSRMTPDDWENLERLYDMFTEEYKKE
jgi:transcriptional regulator with XRE-family HTH domain